MLNTILEVNQIIYQFKKTYCTLAEYHEKVKRDAGMGYGSSPLCGFHVSCWIEGETRAHLLEWPTTDYALSLRQYSKWSEKVGSEIQDIGRVTSVSLAVGSWVIYISEHEESEAIDSETDAKIRAYLKAGYIPCFHCNSAGSVWLPELPR